MKHEQGLKELDFQVMEIAQLAERKFDRPRIGVVVNIQMPAGFSSEDLSKVALSRKTKRGTEVYVGNFFIEPNSVLSFKVYTEVPSSYLDIYDAEIITKIYGKKLVGTTFPDFCWQLADGTNANNVGESHTKFSKAATMGDLTWILPSKFCDDLIETMHSLNLNVLEGLMQDAIMYGPTFEDNSV